MTLSQQTGKLDRDSFRDTLVFFTELDLVTQDEADEVLSMFEPDFAYARAMAAADSVHVHVKVPEVADLPHDTIVAKGVSPTSETEGYIKYPFPGGINMIFSSIPISEDDMLPDAEPPVRAVLDHKGIDLREETDDVRAIFNAVPEDAARGGWRHVPQGGDGVPVYCCHTEVSGKHWVFPGEGAGQKRPIELAYGGLVLHDAKMGCDLRPIDPAHPRAEEARAALSACAASHGADAEPGTSYYEPADLGKFTDVGQFATAHMQRFWAYYNGVFGGDGALTAREKALIGLALAHAHQCPYCIDSFTNSCLDKEVSVEQIHEVLHTSSALAAGVHLVHGVQTRNVLSRRGML